MIARFPVLPSILDIVDGGFVGAHGGAGAFDGCLVGAHTLGAGVGVAADLVGLIPGEHSLLEQLCVAQRLLASVLLLGRIVGAVSFRLV